MGALNLLQLSEKQHSAHPLQLVDESVLPAPLATHRTALYFAWLWDWTLASFIAQGLTTAWLEFMAKLVFPFVTPSMQHAFVGSADSLHWILAGLIHFTLGCCALMASGQTFGMKVFKQHVSDEGQTLTWQQAMLYAAGATVSLVTAGFAIFKLDQLALTRTCTTDYFQWAMRQSSPESVKVDLISLTAAQDTPEEDLKIAA